MGKKCSTRMKNLAANEAGETSQTSEENKLFIRPYNLVVEPPTSRKHARQIYISVKHENHG